MKRLLIALLITLSLFGTALSADFKSYPEAIVSSNQTVSVTAGENLTAGDVVSLVNNYGTVRAYKNNLSINTNPNGAESVANAAVTTMLNAITLDASRFILVFKDSDNYPKAIVGTVSGSSISYGSKTASFANEVTSYVSACLIAPDKVLAVWENGGGAGRACVLTISTNVVTVNSYVRIADTADSPQHGIVIGVDTDKAIFIYNDNTTGKGRAKIITISGTVPTPYPDMTSQGTEFNAAATSYISVSALSATSAIVAYQDGGNSNYGTAQVLSISGTTITPGTEYVFLSANAQYVAVSKLTSTTAAIAFQDDTNSEYGKCVIATNSAGALSYGSTVTFAAVTAADYIAINTIDATHILVSYRDASPNYGKSVVGTISGTTPSFSTASAIQAGRCDYISSCFLTGCTSVIAYQDVGNSSYGTAAVNTALTNDYSAIRGIATANITNGNSGNILLSGEATGLSSLVTGSQYWLQSDFTISTNSVSLPIMKNSSLQTGEVFIGVAKSPTTLWFCPDYR